MFTVSPLMNPASSDAKKSVSFYRAILPLVEKNRRADVERIIAEEQRHLEQLQLMSAHH